MGNLGRIGKFLKDRGHDIGEIGFSTWSAVRKPYFRRDYILKSILYINKDEEVTREKNIEIKEGRVFTSFVGKESATLIVSPKAKVWEVVRCSAFYHCDGIRKEVFRENAIDCFLDFFDIPVVEGYCYLYKRVKSNYSDYYTGEYRYFPGTVVTALDWIDNDRITCGYGLHLAPTLELSKIWNEGGGSRLLICRVAIKDISIFIYRIVQVRCREVEVISEINNE
jgi:hypothetical protein